MGVFQNNLMGAAAAAASAGGGDFYSHQIANSLRNSAAQDGTLKRTAGTPTSSDTFTLSYWVKRYNISSAGSANNIFVAGTGGGTYVIVGYRGTDNEFQFEAAGGNYTGGYMTTNAFYADPSAWYHHVLTFDSTDSTQADRIKMYVNGERITSLFRDTVTAGIGASEDFSFINESGVVQAFGGLSGSGHGTEGADLQMAEIVFNDGQAYGPDSYGETKNGVWIPKDPSGLTFGNNGYYLKFESSSDLGNDSSGNNNDFTAANLAANDQMLDTPTFNSDSNGGNFPAWSPLIKGAVNLSEGNIRMDCTTSGRSAMTTWAIPPGCPTKYYVECLVTGKTGYGLIFGLANPDIDLPTSIEADSSMNGFNFVGYGPSDWRTNALVNGVRQGWSSNVGQTVARVMAITIDRVANEIKCYFDNTLIGNGTISISATETYHIVCSVSGGSAAEVHLNINAGQDSTGGGDFTAGTATDENGYGSFQNAPPSGFLALCSANLPTAAAVDPAQTDDDYPQKLFNTKLYTGTGSSNALTGVGFQPDWTWIKERGGANAHKLTDSTRGVTKAVVIDTNAAETTDSNGLTAFGADGFTVGSDAIYNNSSDTYASWNWRLNGGTEVSNGNGGIASTVQVDPSGGFSLVKYSGTGSASTVGHGLSSAPTWIFAKNTTATASWIIYTTFMTGSYYMSIDAGGMGADSSMWNNTNSTSSVFSVGTAAETNGGTMLAYCWADVEGYIKSGSYEGNGNADGTFVYTGFRPAFIICKSIDSGTSWQLFDDKRVGYNVDNNSFLVDTNVAEATTDMIDILSNGFKMRIATDPNVAETYVYLAIAHNPFQYATAR